MTFQFAFVSRHIAFAAAVAICILPIADVAAQAQAQWLNDQALPQTSSLRSDADTKTTWYDGAKLTIEGKGFNRTAEQWSRLPSRYKKTVTSGVWSTGRNSAGIALRFVTNSPAIYAEWTAPRSSMNHMARSGSNGLDLYAKISGKWEYVGTGIPQTTGTTNARIWPRAYSNTEHDLQKPVTAREYLLFLPTYSELKKLEIGVATSSKIAPAPTSDKKPIVFYGTSISQGACAARSGLGHIERLRRALDHPTVNLGFSGNGKCELIMADLLAEIPASLYVIETVPNMTDEMVKSRTLPFIMKLRAKQPDTPILMVGSPNVSLNSNRNAYWKQAHNQAANSGISRLHYLDGDDLYGPSDNPTVDGVHPTDLGFYYMAVKYEPKIREILDLKDGGSSAKNL